MSPHTEQNRTLTRRARCGSAPQRDIFFDETQQDILEILGDGAASIVERIAILVFTPDCIVSGQTRAVVDWVRARGFQPVTAWRVRLTQTRIRALWSRELSQDRPADGLDRLAVCDRLLTFTDCTAVLLDGSGAPPFRSASERLSSLKGSGEPALRLPGTLRAQLDSPNSAFRLVHTSDSPFEVVRELGVLCDADERGLLLRDVRDRSRITTKRLVDLANACRRSRGSRSLDSTNLIERVIAQIDDERRLAASGSLHAAKCRAKTIVEQVLDRGSSVGARTLFSALAEAQVDLDDWTLIHLGARTLTRDLRDE